MTAPIIFQDPAMLSASVSAEMAARHAQYSLVRLGFGIRVVDPRKPWGVEIKLRGSPDRARKFLASFFGDLEISQAWTDVITPKIILIEQARRTSWHFHERTDTLMHILHGNVGVSMSATDAETVPRVHVPGDWLFVPPLTRHRLSSLSGWAVVAEIGRSVVPGHPGGDDDVRRISDDHGR